MLEVETLSLDTRTLLIQTLRTIEALQSNVLIMYYFSLTSEVLPHMTNPKG